MTLQVAGPPASPRADAGERRRSGSDSDDLGPTQADHWHRVSARITMVQVTTVVRDRRTSKATVTQYSRPG